MLVREQFLQSTVACEACGHHNDDRSEWCADCLHDLPAPSASGTGLKRHHPRPR